MLFDIYVSGRQLMVMAELKRPGSGARQMIDVLHLAWMSGGTFFARDHVAGWSRSTSSLGEGGHDMSAHCTEPR
jgi:hypothetical protein